MDKSKQGEQAWQLHNDIIRNERVRRALFLDNMKYINELHNTGLYKVMLGDENAPWSAYLSQHEVFYSASKVYMMDKIYGKFTRELGLPSEDYADIPTSKLSLLVAFVNKENVHEWLTKARELTSQDFDDEIRISQGKISRLECPHSNEKIYAICQKCGFRHQPNEERKD